MAVYALDAVRETLHGTFSPDLAPVLTIDPGDTVVYRTLISGWTLDRAGTRFAPRDRERDAGHALTGPVAIRGAEPGLALAVRLGEIEPAGWGRSGGGGGPWGLNPRLGLTEGEEVRMEWTLDTGRQVGRNQFGQVVRLRPFMGVLGMPPAEPGLHSTIPPRISGGNIDCRELVSGSTLYLPVSVPGALFSTGDGHAAQGDGEVGTIAIECPMERVEVTFALVERPLLATPYADTPAGWITFGFHENLHEAAFMAIDAMLDFMVARLDLPSRKHALALATAVVSVRVTQLVNQVVGAHALLPYDALLAGGNC